MPAPKGHPPYPGGGRPVKYTDEVLDDIADKLNNWIETTDFVWLDLFEHEYDLYNAALADLVKKNPHHTKLIYAYQRAKRKQKAFLVQNGLLKKHDSPLTKFLLSAVHGMKETSEQIVTQKEAHLPIDDEEYEKAIKYKESSGNQS